MTEIIERILDNRTLVIGLDKMYRDAMKRFEALELLPMARTIARTLNLEPMDVPIEGYYAENDALTEYFKLMRAMQKVSRDRKKEVESLPEFRLLTEITGSPLYGKSAMGTGIFSVGRDSLYFAMNNRNREDWTVSNLVEAAHDAAVQNDDISLVGLAALTRDAVCIAALRESVALYAMAALCEAADEPEYRYVWRVDERLETAVNRFVSTFNGFVPDAIKAAIPENAVYFYEACSDNEIAGRCVRIGEDDSTVPSKYYHWAVSVHGGKLVVDDFWSEDIWTTERYQTEKMSIKNIPV